MEEFIEYNFVLTPEELVRLLKIMNGRTWPEFLDHIEYLESKEVKK